VKQHASTLAECSCSVLPAIRFQPLTMLLFLPAIADYDGCASASCTSGPNSNGACVDVAAPGTGYACVCNDGYWWNGTACTVPCVSVLAGTGADGYSGDSGPATQALLSKPSGVSVDAQGNVYIAGAVRRHCFSCPAPLIYASGSTCGALCWLSLHAVHPLQLVRFVTQHISSA
jgi:hypothetical protein